MLRAGSNCIWRLFLDWVLPRTWLKDRCAMLYYANALEDRLFWNDDLNTLLDYTNHRVMVSKISRLTGWIFRWAKYWIGTPWQVKSHTESYSYMLGLYESSVNIMCIYLYIYMINGNICYLLPATYILKCTGFVFGLEIIYWACGCSTPPLYPFSQV